MNASRTKGVTLYVDGGYIFKVPSASLTFWHALTSIPVISSIGMSAFSMSTTKIRDVMESIPPFLYKSCLQQFNEY